MLAALTAGIVVTLSKAGLKNVNASLAFAIQSVLIFGVAWGVAWWQGFLPEVGRIERRAWLYLVLAGVLTGVSSLLSFQALKLGDASRVSPIERTSLVFAILLAVFFLKERVNWQVLLGAALMVGGAVMIAFATPSGK